MLKLIKDTIYENSHILEVLSRVKDTKDNYWIDMDNPSAVDLDELKKFYRFHTLSIEDCMSKTKRSKIDEFDDYHFLVAVTHQSGQSTYYSYRNLYIFIGENYLITIHYGESKVIRNIINKYKEDLDIFQNGIGFLLYHILDETVDQYFLLTDKLEEDINTLEFKAMNKPVQETLNEIMKAKRNVTKLRRVISPLREVINTLLRHDDIIDEKSRIYFSDIYDHILRIYDLIESDQEMVTSCLELYSSQLSNSMNIVMKFLTSITTIMTSVTLLSGWFGMNFSNMPELSYKYSYFVFIIFVVIMTILQVTFFKKKRWL
jgi:magnesium transporter